MLRVLLTLLWLLLNAPLACADPGKPVAVRWWGQGCVSIETFWNLRVVVDPYRLGAGDADPAITAELVLASAPDSNVLLVRGEPFVAGPLVDMDEVVGPEHVLDRPPNAEAPIWAEATDGGAPSAHAVRVRGIYDFPSYGVPRGDPGPTPMFLIEADGVRILHWGAHRQGQLTPEELKAVGKVDVLIVPIGGRAVARQVADANSAARIVRLVKPRVVVPIHYKSAELSMPPNFVESFLEAMGDAAEVVRSDANTLAVSQAMQEPDKPRVVVLSHEAWRPTGELHRLMDRMEAACVRSQAVFRRLTVEQMNWRPPDGTHTARWNAEHMMGRQLHFFSQVYAALDPAIEEIDLNPAQMPDDYRAAHPDWTGAEEARQMQRASEFVRRSAYLLDGVDLYAPAPGSRWTLRRLLVQMEKHFDEHTANVRRKFPREFAEGQGEWDMPSRDTPQD